MPRSLILIICILMQSCGILIDQDTINGDKRQFSSSNPVFYEYISSFEQDARAVTQNQNFSVGDIPINFGDTKNPLFDGLCIKYSNGEREVIIKKSWWDRTSKTEREVLLYHELGHCRLNRSHDEHTLDSHKTSIMNPVVPDVYSYTEYKYQYLSELFTGSKQQLIDALSI